MKIQLSKKQLLWISGLLFCTAALRAQVREPYGPVGNGSFSGAAVPQSPDPLITYRWHHPVIGDALQTYTLQPVKVKVSDPSSFVMPPISQVNSVGITVHGRGDLIFDFGVESAGWLEFQSDDLADSVEMSISEYNEPAIVNAGAQTPVKTKRPVKYGNTYRLELNDGLYEGVRFGWIHVGNYTKPWHIKNIKLVCQICPANYDGSFWCNDTLLTRIWYTGAYTVKLNLLKDYFGAILMERSDRQSWTGDVYPSQAAALAAFGNYDRVKANLSFTSTQQDNGIAAYSLYWVLSLVDYFNYSGDSSFFNGLTANAARRLDKAYQQYDSLPHLGFMGWDERLGAGFENPNTTEAADTYRMLCIKTWSRFAKALKLAGNSDLAAKYEGYAAARSSRVQDELISRLGIHALSEAIDGGMIKNEKTDRYAARLFGDRNGRLSYSPFNQYFIIQAMATAGRYPEALAAIEDCWGGQIRYGGTTFFEVYRPSWNDILQPNDAPPNNQCGYTSLAHPWGAGVTKWLSEEVLGIKPVTPGFRTFTVLPHIGAGITTVKGTMPTPYGPVKASFDILSGDNSVTVPPGALAVRIGLPKAGRNVKTVYVNGRLILAGQTQDNQYFYLNNLRPGTYRIKVTYGGKSGRPVETGKSGSPIYPVGRFIQDSTTSGSWEGKYGRDGYMLFGYHKNEDLYKLPAYIRSVTPGRNAFVIWDSIAPDARAAGAGAHRKAAAIITRDPIPTLQTFTIDVAAKDTLAHTISLYFLDYDHKGRRSTIELFDAGNLNLIAPVQLVQRYEKGKYISFSCKGSVRIRIDQVRGVNAAVSGIFFD